MTTKTSSTYDMLLSYEADGSNPGDGRRVIRDERMRLHSALQAANEANRAAAAKAANAAKWSRDPSCVAASRAAADIAQAARARADEVAAEAARTLALWA